MTGSSESGRLIGVHHLPEAGAQLVHAGRLSIGRSADQRRYLTVVEESVPQRGYGAATGVRRPVNQGRLGDQVTDRHVQGLRELLDDGEPIDRDVVVLHLADPVGRALDHVRQHLLGHPPGVSPTP